MALSLFQVPTPSKVRSDVIAPADGGNKFMFNGSIRVLSLQEKASDQVVSVLK